MPQKPFFIRMKKKRKHQQRLQDAARLFLRASAVTGLGSLLLGLASWFLLGALPPLPYLLIGFGAFSLLNAALFRYHDHLALSYHLGSLAALLAIMAGSLYSGGLQSPMIFLLGLLVLSGYMKHRFLGHGYLAVSIVALALLLAREQVGALPGYNAIPEGSRALFTFLVVLLFVGLLGGIFGYSLLKSLHGLYQSKEDLEQRVAEKELLLKEVHHRVKNNLQTVSSLLRMQGRTIEDDQTLRQIRSSQNRVVCMAMVHEMLYMREDLSRIEYSSYVQQLGEYLVKSIKGPESKIRLKIDIPEIELGIDTAIPLGLLINEAVTNALKYGFEGQEEGEISISLEKEDRQEYILRIGDNGVGFPEDMDYQTSKSLGLKLIHNLTRQLKGSVIRDLSRRGTYYIIRFQEVGQDPFHSLA